MTPPRSAGADAAKPAALLYDSDVISLQGSSDALKAALGIPYDSGLAALLATLATLALLLLVVVCTNVGALVITASVERRAEIAVRLSLGASRARVIRQLLTESVVLSAFGGMLGLVGVWGLIVALRRIPTAAFFRPDLGTLAFTMSIALGTGIVCGLTPALHATRSGVAAALKDATVASRRSRLHQAFVVAQVMFTQPLLMFVGIIIGSLIIVPKQPLPHGVSQRILKLDLDLGSMPGLVTAKNAAADRLALRIAQTPGVASVVPEPVFLRQTTLIVRAEDRDPVAGAPDHLTALIEFVTPGYFDLLDVPLLRGSDVAPSSDTSRTVIVGSDLARRLWGGADPIGRRFIELLQAQRRDLVVSGVYDSRYFAQSDAELVFRSAARLSSGKYLIRTVAPASDLAVSIRGIAREEIPLAPIRSLLTMQQFEIESSRGARSLRAGLAACGALVLFLSSIGLYGAVALGVRQRRREIGVRMALGARAEQVIALFYSEGLRLSILGLLLGLPISVAAAYRIDTQPAGNAMPSHALVGGLIALVVLVLASVATVIPAARAARVSPAISLRSE